jgi:anti-sigma factor RsiW
MKCDDFHAWISEYLDGELPSADRSRCDAHLQACPECRREMETILRAQRLLTANLPELEPEPRLWSAVAASLPDGQRRRWWDFLRARPVWLAGGAAAILAVVGAVAVIWQSQRGLLETIDLQRELESHIRYRRTVVAQGNPFGTGEPPAEVRAKDPDNPFTPYLRHRSANPFKEMGQRE